MKEFLIPGTWVVSIVEKRRHKHNQYFAGVKSKNVTAAKFVTTKILEIGILTRETGVSIKPRVKHVACETLGKIAKNTQAREVGRQSVLIYKSMSVTHFVLKFILDAALGLYADTVFDGSTRQILQTI